ncbi:hypothetical protein [Pelomonas sp. Root1237]|uniref:hypothetical protein n=1 Tax=Pelomonas sp. Root1237 TaxID=1736434 RepID=UPI000A7AC301|nr:hypothetical protein [Pelomonas sp. Root1237]
MAERVLPFGDGTAIRVTTHLTPAAKGQLLTAVAMDAHNTLGQPQVITPVPFSAMPARKAWCWNCRPSPSSLSGCRSTH